MSDKPKIMLNTLSQLQHHGRAKPLETYAQDSGVLTALMASYFAPKDRPLFLYYFNAEGQDLTGVDTPNLSDTEDGASIYYAKAHVPQGWAKVLLKSPLPSWTEHTSMEWLSDLDDLNVRWRVVLEEWSELTLPDAVQSAIGQLFKGLGVLPPRQQPSATLAEQMKAAQEIIGRGSVLTKETEGYIPETMLWHLPSIHQSLLEVQERREMESASELEFTRKIYGRLLDPYFPTTQRHQFEHISSQNTSALTAETSRPDFRVDWCRTGLKRVTIIITEDAAETIEGFPAKHKDWRKLIQLLRQSLSNSIKNLQVPIEKARVFGFLFGGLTYSVMSMRAEAITETDGTTKLGFYVSMTPVREFFTDTEGELVEFYKVLAGIYNCAPSQTSETLREKKEWQISEEKLVDAGRKPKKTLLKSRETHFFPFRSFFPAQEPSTKRVKKVDEEEQ